MVFRAVSGRGQMPVKTRAWVSRPLSSVELSASACFQIGDGPVEPPLMFLNIRLEIKRAGGFGARGILG